MKGALQVMQHMKGDGDTEMKRKMETIQEELKEKEEELDDVEELNQTLIINERKSNDELQDARKELITVSIFYIPSFFFFLLLECITSFCLSCQINLVCIRYWVSCECWAISS